MTALDRPHVELHLKFDAVAISYRRAMQQQGLDYYHYRDVVKD